MLARWRAAPPTGGVTDSGKPTDTPRIDGRRQRSENNRARIVDAMLELIAEDAGQGLPSAEAVAARAGVGLRTVFRLFEDMDGLYRGMQQAMMQRFAPMLAPPPSTGDWREELRVELGRRSELFEVLLPLQIAADSQRHRSPALQEGKARMVALSRALLLNLLPEQATRDADRLSALEMTVSFEAWRRLRMEQGLSIEDARRVMTWMSDRLLEDVSA
jgi:AcrR family transcriptional regulator